MKLLIAGLLALLLTSCIHVTVQSDPPEEWLKVWSACYNDPTGECDPSKIRGWYGLPPTDGTGTRYSQ